MEFDLFIELIKKYGPGTGFSALLGYLFFKVIEYLTLQFKNNLSELTGTFNENSKSQRETHKATLDEMIKSNEKISANALEMMKMNQDHSRTMLNNISEHNLRVHQTMDTRMVNIESSMQKVEKTLVDITEKIENHNG